MIDIIAIVLFVACFCVGIGGAASYLEEISNNKIMDEITRNKLKFMVIIASLIIWVITGFHLFGANIL